MQGGYSIIFREEMSGVEIQEDSESTVCIVTCGADSSGSAEMTPLIHYGCLPKMMTPSAPNDGAAILQHFLHSKYCIKHGAVPSFLFQFEQILSKPAANLQHSQYFLLLLCFA